MEVSGHLNALATLPPRKHPPPQIHRVGGSVGTRVGLDVLAKKKKKIHCPCKELNHCPARSVVIIVTEGSMLNIKLDLYK
jgi:hypothetical protein